jgi:Flp pilus assembly secretin CpaC
MSVRASLAVLLLLAGSAHADRDHLKRPINVKKDIAQAPAVKVTCDVIEISASTGKEASIDPAIKKLEKKLRAQPWTFNQYKLLSTGSKTLEKGKQENLGLKEGVGTATLVETVDKSKVRLTITEEHGGKRLINNTTTIAAGDWLIQGHPVPPNKDGHLVAISCK